MIEEKGSARDEAQQFSFRLSEHKWQQASYGRKSLPALLLHNIKARFYNDFPSTVNLAADSIRSSLSLSCPLDSSFVSIFTVE